MIPMIRPLILVAALLATPLAFAQEASPDAATPDIEIDAGAPINAMPRQADLLTGIYATQAVIDICSITVPEAAATRMGHDRTRFETLLGLDAAGAAEAYGKVKDDVASTTPDCADGSTDRQNVDAVLKLYAGT